MKKFVTIAVLLCAVTISSTVSAARDVVVGDLESFGTHEIYNLTDDENFSLWVDNFWLSESQALDWLERGY